jgi:hypothetical protein
MDPLLSSSEWRGIISMRYFKHRARNVWLIGEQHSDIPNHATRVLLRALKANPEKTHLYLEADYLKYQDATLHRVSKLYNPEKLELFEKEVSNLKKLHHAHYLRMIPDHVETHYCNIRGTLPFGLLYLWTNPDEFVNIFAYKLLDIPGDKRAICKKWAKKLESAFLENITNSTETITFFESLIFPDKEMPKWFLDIELAIFKRNSENNVKFILQQLKTRDPMFYEHLRNTFMNILELQIKHHGKHTKVLKKMKRRNLRNNTPVLQRDSKWLEPYFFMMILLIQDVYMAAMYGSLRKDGKNHLFMTGNLHIPFLLAVLAPKSLSIEAWEHKQDFLIRKEYHTKITMNYPNLASDLDAFQEDPSPVSPDILLQTIETNESDEKL